MQIFFQLFSILAFSTVQASFSVTKWNKRLQDFEPLPGWPYSQAAERRKFIAQSRQEELHDFNGEPLHLTYYQELGFFEFYDNDTKATGVCADIWNILAKLLNFTLVITRSNKTSLGIRLKNGSYTGVLEYARLNQTDVIPKMEVHNSRISAVTFTPGLWSNSFRIFTNGQWNRNETWLFYLFTVEVWWIIGVFILWLSISSFVMQTVLIRKRGLKLRPLSYVGHLLYIFASVCNQGSVPENDSVASSILMITTALFAGFVLTGYTSRLLYNMTLEVLAAPFNSLETLLTNTKLHVVVRNGSMGHMMFSNLQAKARFVSVIKAKRMTVASNLTEVYSKVCSNSDKFVLFDGMDEVAARGKKLCPLVPIGETYYPAAMASGISRRVKYKRTLDIGVARLREYGIIDRIRDRYVPSKNIESSVDQGGLVTINMDHVSAILELLGVGILLSIVICAAENYLASRRCKKMSVTK